LSPEKFNDYLKEACQAVGFTDKGRPIHRTRQGALASNLYLEGYSIIDLMRITGHKTEMAFLKYIHVSKLDWRFR
jgi:hypothetical protein